MQPFGHTPSIVRTPHRNLQRLASVAALSFAGLSLSVNAHAENAENAENAVSSADNGGDSVELARSHFLRGVEFYNAGDYKLSLEEFRRSYELSQNYRILYNIGQVQQQLNNYAKALLALERYLEEGGAEIPEARRTEVDAYIAELKKKVAHVVLVANVAEPEVLVDGFPNSQRDSSRRITLDPGDHRIELRKPGYQPLITVVTLAAGDTTELRLALSRPAPQKLARTVVPAKRERSVPWVGWITTGALAAGAGVMGALATSEASDLAKLRGSVSSDAQREAVGKRAHAYAIACDALAAAAVVSGGVSLYFTLHTTRSEPQRPPTAQTRLVLTGNRVLVSGSF